MKKNNPTIGIIGGTGKMGQWFMKFFQEQNLPVLTAGRKTPLSIKELVIKSDIIIVSVPLSETQRVIKSILPYLRKDSLLTDLTSLKEISLKTMKNAKSGTLGMHPLFGPTANLAQGLKIVFCRQKDNEYVNFLKSLLTKAGIKVIEFSEEEHDYQMAYIQAFTHAVNLLYAKIIFKQNNILKNKVLTPIFALQVLVMGRILHQDLKLLSNIQFYNPYFLSVLEAFVEEGKRLLGIIKSRDEKGFDKMFFKEKELARNFSCFSALQTNKILQQASDTTPVIPTGIEKLETKGVSSPAKIAYLGPEGTFSHLAAMTVFPKKTQRKNPYLTPFDLFKAVLENRVDYAIVAAENSIEGTVRETLDYLIDFSLSTIGSFDLPIHQQLLTNEKSLGNIYYVVSHPQALAQCKLWLRKNLPQAELISAQSTTAGLQHPKRGSAYIASEIAAKKYKMKILARNIEDHPANTTRFYIITKKQVELKEISNKKTLLFATAHNRVGILRDILNVFADNGINLSKLESRPSFDKLWDYHFFIEVERQENDRILNETLKQLEPSCPIIRILGRT